ncbi:MAG: SUMF1/EgtB/PvdO family nonheme iron enzyme [Anaerolineales bacterium]|nr:SUMF1/EgtB/PvdO family nonheme iron enzyme [Anaerolineales bacterium]
MKRLVPSLFAIIILACVAGGCESESTPTLGDTWTRPTDGMVMVFVPAGEFQMGSDDSEVDSALEMCNAYYEGECRREWFAVEGPVHTVALDEFWIDQREVTNVQYRGCVEAGACEPPANSSSDTRQRYYGDAAYDDFRVIKVNWEQVDA